MAGLAEDLVISTDLSVEEVEQERDPVEQLRIAAHLMRLLNQRSWLVADILRTAHGTDRGLSRTWRQWQKRHFSAVGRAMAALASRGALHSQLSTDRAADAMYALAGTDVYRVLVQEPRLVTR